MGTRIEAVGFWASILAPACYFSVLLVGLENVPIGRCGFLGLVGLHLVSLVVGHSHGRR